MFPKLMLVLVVKEIKNQLAVICGNIRRRWCEMNNSYGTQISMFDGNRKFVINKPIRLIELFA